MKVFPMNQPFKDKTNFLDVVMLQHQLQTLSQDGYTTIRVYKEPGVSLDVPIEDTMDYLSGVCAEDNPLIRF